MNKGIIGFLITITGFMYYLIPSVWSIEQSLIDIGLYELFIISSLSCGLSGILIPSRVSMSLVVFPVFVMSLSIGSHWSQTISGFIFYSSIFALPVFIESRRTKRLRILKNWETRNYMGVIMAMMACGLIALPDGIGLNYIYNQLSFMPYPQAFYQIIFTAGAILCAIPFRPKYVTPYLFGFGMLIHSGMFIYISVIKTGAYDLTPMFILGFYVWIMASREVINEYNNYGATTGHI